MGTWRERPGNRTSWFENYHRGSMLKNKHISLEYYILRNIWSQMFQRQDVWQASNILWYLRNIKPQTVFIMHTNMPQSYHCDEPRRSD